MGVDTSAWEHYNADNYYTAASTFGLIALPNGGANPPAASDIVVFEGGPAGHVAVVSSVSPTAVNIIEQNWSYTGTASLILNSSNGGYAVTRAESAYVVLGWLRKGGVAVYAPSGQIIYGFPTQLILDSTAAITNSYSIASSSTVVQYTVEWNSSNSMTSLYNTYKQYLTANGWTITNVTTQSTAVSLSAGNTSSSLNIVINARGNGAQVLLSYTTGSGISGNPVPTITQLNPALLPVGAAPQMLTIAGTGFLSSSTVQLNGVLHAATFVSSGQLTISLSTADLALVGTYPVMVTNPAPGGGTSAAANFSVASVQVAHEWTWVSGADTANQPGASGTQGVPAVANVPGGRSCAVSWPISGGNLWLFGGFGYDSTGHGGYLNDLWEFSPTNATWTWVSGADTANQLGIYGSQGISASTNVPGGRSCAVTWTDSSGNFWLFGGVGFDSTGNNDRGYFNDLWEFNPTSKTWTWMSGTDAFNQAGVYGTEGVPASGNRPGARYSAVSWTDSSGNLWLFGGGVIDLTGSLTVLNDLWEFNPTSKTWTWVNGTDAFNQAGVYGTQGAPAVANVPGARYNAASWTDSSGNLWLFGGYGYDSTGTVADLNDLWEFNLASKIWTWMSGADTGNQPGVYGMQGVPAPADVPGARYGAISWRDSSGNLWLSDGYGFDSTGKIGALNDLWEFNPTSQVWTWVSGNNTNCGYNCGQPGVYGTQGFPAAANIPGARENAASWTDSSGNLWLFGGGGYPSTTGVGYLNDLWRYQP
jgi:N-acetylneuraminic acid mutarotase